MSFFQGSDTYSGKGTKAMAYSELLVPDWPRRRYNMSTTAFKQGSIAPTDAALESAAVYFDPHHSCHMPRWNRP